jgi:Icc-related predicted phosphoesterase
VRIVCTADFHGMYPRPEDLPAGEVLVFAGDLHGGGLPEDTLRRAENWLDAVRGAYDWVVGIAGNHDRMFEDPLVGPTLPWIYLHDTSVVLDGLKFHGSPWSNQFFDWSFMGSENELAEKWKLIPDDTDVMIVHGPAYGVLDLAQRSVNCGSKTLRDRVLEVKPRLLVTGHIHEARGQDQLGATHCVNGSYVDAGYRPGCPPIVVELD